MSGYPNQPSGYGYGAPPSAPPYSTPPSGQPYGAPPSGQPYGAPSSGQPYGTPPSGQPYGAPPHGQHHSPNPYGASHGQGSPYDQVAGPYGAPYSSSSGHNKPPKDHPQSYGSGYPQSSAPPHASPFATLVPSSFPPGTDPNIIACFQLADQDGSGLVDDKELQRALSSYNQSFSLRTVHLLMYHFTNTNIRKIGPKEFTPLFYSLQQWRANFERFDKDRSGKIEASELRDALLSMGFAVPPVVLDLLISKFDKTGGKNKAIEYDNFIECCLTVKGLTDKFREKDTTYCGSATFSYEAFMLTVLPFLIA